jgi:capsular exopolysaccharide synthesis family protein
VARLFGRNKGHQVEVTGSTLGEAYRILRTNLMVALTDLERPTVIFTSTSAGEGKTSTVVNLAKVMALAGQRVVVVDCDLRHPDVHNRLQLGNDQGLVDVLLDRAPLSDCLQFVEIRQNPGQPQRGAYVLTSGTVPINPAELLSGSRTARLLDALSSQADLVLIDSPPVLPIADALVIGRLVAGAVLVVEARRTPVPAIQQAKDALIRNQTRLLGVVVNKIQSRDRPDLGYGGYYDDQEAGAPPPAERVGELGG